MNSPLSPGEFAWFYHLHLDTAKLISKAPDEEENHTFKIEAKHRPFFVFQEIEESHNGKRKYRLLKVASTGRDEKGAYFYELDLETAVRISAPPEEEEAHTFHVKGNQRSFSAPQEIERLHERPRWYLLLKV